MASARSVNVYFLPNRVPTHVLEGHTVVVIDVLRATTTIVAALAAGARSVMPCLSIDEARRRAEQLGGDALLAGERGGLKIEGFDLGNSPSEFTLQIVAAKTLVMTTTNGTKALLSVAKASEILIGAFVNLSAVCRSVSPDTPLDIVCAGTDEEVTEDDVLVAGALVRRLALGDAMVELNDSAQIARDTWSRFKERGESLADALRTTRGGRNLVDIGMQPDIGFAAKIDRYDLVPRFFPDTGEIRADSAP